MDGMYMKEKQPLKEGNFIQIKINDSYYCFGRVLKEPLIAFYDLKSDKLYDINEISSLPILFKVPVMNHAIKSGKWKVIGYSELEASLKKPVRFFTKDPLTGRYFIYTDADSKQIPATQKECEGLERAAVWDPEHIEERLRDYYSNSPNQWVESLK